MNLLKIILIVLGTFSLCMGIIGVFVPGLPTTPFLLLTAGLYIKSSDKLYNKLISTKFVGRYILEYRRKKGMSIKSKITAIVFMWAMIAISCTFFIKQLHVIIIVIGVGFIGTIVMGFVVRTAKNEK